MNSAELLNMINSLDKGSRTAIETIVKNLVAANDPEHIKLTTAERQNLEEALTETQTISHDDLKKELGL